MKHAYRADLSAPTDRPDLPFALPLVAGKKFKKKCCKKYKKGKRCKRCPGRR